MAASSSLVAAVGVFTCLGIWLDRKLGNEVPWLTMLGAVLGMTGRVHQLLQAGARGARKRNDVKHQLATAALAARLRPRRRSRRGAHRRGALLGAGDLRASPPSPRSSPSAASRRNAEEAGPGGARRHDGHVPRPHPARRARRVRRRRARARASSRSSSRSSCPTSSSAPSRARSSTPSAAERDRPHDRRQPRHPRAHPLARPGHRSRRDVRIPRQPGARRQRRPPRARRPTRRARRPIRTAARRARRGRRGRGTARRRAPRTQATTRASAR